MPSFLRCSDLFFEQHRITSDGWLATVANGREIRTGCAALIGALLVTGSIAHARRQIMDKIVFHYYSDDPGNREHVKIHDDGSTDHWTRVIKKPAGVPGSKNYIWQYGAETNDVYEISKFEVRNGAGRTLFVSWDFMTWATVSTESVDYYYLMAEAQASDAALLDPRNLRFRRINPDASANAYSFPYHIIVISRAGIRKFACTFDKSVFVAPNEKKVLASPTGQGRPQGAIDLIMRRLSTHGARMQADRCRPFK